MAVSTRPSALPGRPLRLLHAADLHVERVVSGVREISDHLRPRLVESSYAAARRVFEAALSEDVSAVLLAGDVVDLSLAGPRAVVFLREQFEMLSAQGIEVYWAGGRVDPPGAWPRVTPLPGNVHVFPAEHVEHFDLHQDGETVARILGISHDGEAQPGLSRFVPHPDGAPTIGVTYGKFSRADLKDQRVHYVAAGGRHGRKSYATGDRKRMLHYPGATQGSSPYEAGPHGCTLVTLYPDGAIQTQRIATDVVRWQSHCVEVDGSTDLAEVERQIVAQTDSLRSSASAVDFLVRWEVAGSGPAMEALSRSSARRALVERLRDRFGSDNPCVWTVEVEVARSASIAEAFLAEETILGDVLREIEKLEDEPVESLELSTYLAPSDRNSPLADRLTHLSPADRQQVLDQTREDCVALLLRRGREGQRHPATAQTG